jgi:hypothetical protein
MSKEDRNRADARFTKTAGAKPGKSDHDIAAKAVLDNMAKLKALRLAREDENPGAVGLAGRPAERRPAHLISNIGQGRNGTFGMGDPGNKREPPDPGAPEPQPVQPVEDDDREDGDIATPKRDCNDEDDQPL